MLLRDTSTYNRCYARQSPTVRGAYERASRDNSYQLYTAGGVGCLVLNLEMWRRSGVVTWAQRVVAGHPRHNVIVVTHHYLSRTGAISTQRHYGDTAPNALARELILKYPNVRMVFSGTPGPPATGSTGDCMATGRLLLTTMHDGTATRSVWPRSDTRTNSLKTWVYAPWTQTSYPAVHREELAALTRRQRLDW